MVNHLVMYDFESEFPYVVHITNRFKRFEFIEVFDRCAGYNYSVIRGNNPLEDYRLSELDYSDDDSIYLLDNVKLSKQALESWLQNANWKDVWYGYVPVDDDYDEWEPQDRYKNYYFWSSEGSMNACEVEGLSRGKLFEPVLP